MARVRLQWIWLGLFLFIGGTAWSQNRSKPAGSVFSDGVYRTITAFQTNQPDYTWDQIQGTWFYNPESGVTTVVELRVPQIGALPLDSLWGICISGQPAVRIPRDSISRTSVIFAQLKPVGAISYFAYEGALRDTIEVAAYNPVTGLPFRKGKVPRSSSTYRTRILHFQTGEVRPLSAENLIIWVGSDAELRRALGQLRETDPEKLLRAIEVYNQRNPIRFNK